MANIITYETIYEILRKEKYNPEIQKLSKTFFQDIINYLKEKESLLKSQQKKGTFPRETEKNKKQIENIKKILKELYERRENKIIQLALLSSRSDKKDDLSNLLSEEKQLFNEFKNIFIQYKSNILDKVLTQKLPELKPKDIKIEKPNSTKLVRFTHTVPKFIGDDLYTYGPFESENLASLPAKVADVLVKRKRAEEIK